MDEIDLLIEKQDYIDREMIDVSFEFWFRDHDNVRSPFPDYIKSDLKTSAVKNFLEWSAKLTPEAKKEINDEILLERFEEIMFEEALKMVMSEEEKITVKYPFMLRIGDKVAQGEKPESLVVAREIMLDNDTPYLKVTFAETANGNKWESSFEIPG
jgi:hypothetical protein